MLCSMDQPQVLQTVTHAKRPKLVTRVLIAIGNTVLALTPLSVELNATRSNGAQIGVKELVDLHKHYETIIRSELDFCHKYLNFYVILFTTLLGGTIAGLVTKPPVPLRYMLMMGPGLILFFSFIGYKTVSVFYRRYIEAWITSLNVRAMLGLNGNEKLASGIGQPLYRSEINGGFIADWDNEDITAIRKEAVNRCSAEKIAKKIVEKGQTLRHARWIFVFFGLAGLALLAIVVAMPVPL
jgi:hypothetical protein